MERKEGKDLLFIFQAGTEVSKRDPSSDPTIIPMYLARSPYLK